MKAGAFGRKQISELFKCNVGQAFGGGHAEGSMGYRLKCEIHQCRRCHPHGPASPRRKKKQAMGFWNVGLTSHRAPMELTMLYPNSLVVLCKAILTVTAPVGTSVPQMGHVRDKALFGHTHNTRFQCSESHYGRFSQIRFHVPRPSPPFLNI